MTGATTAGSSLSASRGSCAQAQRIVSPIAHVCKPATAANFSSLSYSDPDAIPIAEEGATRHPSEQDSSGEGHGTRDCTTLRHCTAINEPMYAVAGIHRGHVADLVTRTDR